MVPGRRRAVAEQAPAAAGAADLRGRRARGLARAIRLSIAGVDTPGASRFDSPIRWRSAGRPRPSRRARARRASPPPCRGCARSSRRWAVAVDVALGDLPVVRARVPRRAGVGEHDATFELGRIDGERHPPDAVDAEFDGRDAAVKRRAVVLDAGRHRIVWHSTFIAICSRCSRPSTAAGAVRQRAADGDRQGRRAGDTGAGGGFASRGQGRVLEAVVAGQQGEQGQFAGIRRGSDQRAPTCAGVVSIDRSSSRPSVRGSIVGVRAQADRRVQRDAPS